VSGAGIVTSDRGHGEGGDVERRLPGGREREYDFGLEPGERFEPGELDGDNAFDLSQPHVMTALGPIPPEELGVCLVEEHLLARPEPSGSFDPDLILVDRDAALAELEDLYNAGGRAVVEVSTDDYGRDLEGVRWVAARAPVHVVVVTGHHRELFALPRVSGRSIDELAAGMVRDLTEGIGGTTARAGAIVVGTSLHAVAPVEERGLRAAAQASLATGAPVATVAERGTMALERVAILRDSGVSPDRIVVGRLARRLDDFGYLRSVLETGVFVAFDNIGTDDSDADEARAAVVNRLVDDGFGDRLLLSGGQGRRSALLAYGGEPGLGYIVERFPLLLMEAGVTAATVRRLLVENPALALTIRRPAAPIDARR
jgi:phosphotriesterase-related protein